MARLISVAYTEQAVLERRKTVTRRKGWWFDKRGRRLLVEGDHLTLCRKVMGRKAGEPLVRLVDVEVLDVRREQLADLITDRAYGVAEMEREGFPGMAPVDFVDQFFVQAQGIPPGEDVTRIAYRYLEVHAGPPVGSGQMPCCLRPVFEAEAWHRLTYDPDAVTCPGPVAQIREQVPA